MFYLTTLLLFISPLLMTLIDFNKFLKFYFF